MFSKAPVLGFLGFVTLAATFFSSNLQAASCTSAWREVDYRIVPFPDLGARYLSYQFRIPKGQSVVLRFKGDFPVARYMSYHVYDQVTEDSLSSILDSDISPSNGSVNPYQVGVDRYATNRNYEVVAACSNSIVAKSAKNFIRLPCSDSDDTLIDIWYRIYLNERNLDFPEIESIDAASGMPNEQCPKVELKEDSIATVPYETGRRPAPFIQGRVPLPFSSGDVHFYHPQSTALGANDHVRYLSTRLDGHILSGEGPVRAKIERTALKRHGVINDIGDTTILKFRAPTFPDTSKGLKAFDGTHEVRYWSMCVSGELTDASNCLADTDAKRIPCDASDTKKLCVGLLVGDNQPEVKQAAQNMGYNFLTHASHRAPILFYRQMLARPDFKGRLENVKMISKQDFVPPSGEEVETYQTPPERVRDFFGDSVIGDYSPVGRQCYFENMSNLGC